MNTTAKPPRWPKNDVRGQILTWCVHSTTVAEIAARLSLPLGATRFLVDDLVTQGYLRVCAPLGDSLTIDERRELLSRTLVKEHEPSEGRCGPVAVADGTSGKALTGNDDRSRMCPCAAIDGP